MEKFDFPKLTMKMEEAFKELKKNHNHEDVIIWKKLGYKNIRLINKILRKNPNLCIEMKRQINSRISLLKFLNNKIKRLRGVTGGNLGQQHQVKRSKICWDNSDKVFNGNIKTIVASNLSHDDINQFLENVKSSFVIKGGV